MKHWILCVLLAGCTSHTVRCDAHLEPINRPAPKAAAGTAAVP